MSKQNMKACALYSEPTLHAFTCCHEVCHVAIWTLPYMYQNLAEDGKPANHAMLTTQATVARLYCQPSRFLYLTVLVLRGCPSQS